ncbi:MAG: pseudouridine synthase [Chitinophagaceae bacterium]
MIKKKQFNPAALAKKADDMKQQQRQRQQAKNDRKKAEEQAEFLERKKRKRLAASTETNTDKKGSAKASDEDQEQMPLNKFVAHCGVSSRREAVELIRKGKITVNGEVVLEPATKVSKTDKVEFDKKRIQPQVDFVYFLLNKPKDYITTTSDPEGRKTVLDLFQGLEDKRIYPVGRLDRNTTGLLLLTNDGELAQKLAHPKHKIRKIYQVKLDKPLSKKDFERIVEGVVLEDGKADIDELAYTSPDDKSEVGIELHIGRNRIVRRIFEHLGYTVKHLDRVVYAGLTKKNLPRGKWRPLLPKEIIFLKHF